MRTTKQPKNDGTFHFPPILPKMIQYKTLRTNQYQLIGASLSEPHCYVANRGKRNALWCVRTRNFSTLIKIPSACDRNFYQFLVNLPIVFPSSQLLRQFAWLSELK